jgi:hypothetical protein
MLKLTKPEIRKYPDNDIVELKYTDNEESIIFYRATKPNAMVHAMVFDDLLDARKNSIEGYHIYGCELSDIPVSSLQGELKLKEVYVREWADYPVNPSNLICRCVLEGANGEDLYLSISFPFEEEKCLYVNLLPRFDEHHGDTRQFRLYDFYLEKTKWQPVYLKLCLGLVQELADYITKLTKLQKA